MNIKIQTLKSDIVTVLEREEKRNLRRVARGAENLSCEYNKDHNDILIQALQYDFYGEDVKQTRVFNFKDNKMIFIDGLCVLELSQVNDVVESYIKSQLA